jgi:hypothetical protein
LRFARQRGSYIVMRRGSGGCVVPNHRELKIGTLVFLQKNSSSHFMPNMRFEWTLRQQKLRLLSPHPSSWALGPNHTDWYIADENR